MTAEKPRFFAIGRRRRLSSFDTTLGVDLPGDFRGDGGCVALVSKSSSNPLSRTLPPFAAMSLAIASRVRFA